MEKFGIIWGVAHSKNVAGKQSPDGKHRESDWSLARCNDLKKLSAAYGISSHVLQPQSDDLSGRVAFVNAADIIASNYEFCLLVSVHNNAAGNGLWMNAHGWCVYTSIGKTQSDACANIIHDKISKAFPLFIQRKDISDGDPDFENNFTVLMGKNYKAVLIEWLFQDNKEDLALIENDVNNATLIQALIDSVLEIKSKFQ